MDGDLLEALAISRLIQDWGLWRDTGRWNELRAAYTQDGWMRTTWFDGPASAFVDASAASFGKGPQVLHAVGPSTVRVRHDRAVAETRLTILLRDRLHGVPVDVTCHGRVIDRLMRGGERWRIRSRLPIYDKDTISPVEPGTALAIDADALARFPAGYRHLAYLQSLAGLRVLMDIPSPNSDAQAALYRDADEWLAKI